MTCGLLDLFLWLGSRSGNLTWTILCALNRLQAVDLTFCLIIAPRHVDSVTDGVDITVKSTGKMDQEGEARMNGVLDPSFESRRSLATKYTAESRGKAAQNSRGF
jgi:hypothetical protein